MRSRLLIALGFVLAYVYAVPYFGKLQSANELPRVLLTQEIVRNGSFRIDGRLGEMGSRFDVSVTPDGHAYSNKAPGLSLLAVPPYLALEAVHRIVGGTPSLAETTIVLRAVAVTLPALLFLLGFFALARRFTRADGREDEGPAGEDGARVALLAYGLGSMALPYGLLFMSHQLSAACAGGAFVAAVHLTRAEPRRPGWLAFAVGLLAGLSVLVDYQSLLAAAAVGLYLLVRSRRRVRELLLAAAGALPSALALMLYQWVCFGSPFRLSYAYAADPAHKQGLLGIVGPNGPAFFQALLAPDNGLLVLSPWILLAVMGTLVVISSRAARAKIGAETVVCVGVVAAYGLFIGSLEPSFGRGGWCVGPRYIAVAMPFLAWLAAPGFAAAWRRPATRVLAGALVVVGVVVHVAAATTYPHWPVGGAGAGAYFRNPLYEVSFRALREGLAPWSLGVLAGLRGPVSLLPLYAAIGLLALGLLARRGQGGRGLVGALAACLLAGAIVLAYSRFPATEPGLADRKWAYIVSTWEPR